MDNGKCPRCGCEDVEDVYGLLVCMGCNYEFGDDPDETTEELDFE